MKRAGLNNVMAREMGLEPVENSGVKNGEKTRVNAIKMLEGKVARGESLLPVDLAKAYLESKVYVQEGVLTFRNLSTILRHWALAFTVQPSLTNTPS